MRRKSVQVQDMQIKYDAKKSEISSSSVSSHQKSSHESRPRSLVDTYSLKKKHTTAVVVKSSDLC